MNGTYWTIAGCRIRVLEYAVVVVGSGAAGLAAALRLQQGGCGSFALLTENRLAGTSRNAGSDKQTYYKLSLAGDQPDSVGDLAETLFRGGCMDGDQARTEAALSADCFHWLCQLGVPFPRNRYGEAVGYKTDHDPKTRATSAGPLTSRIMVEKMEQELMRHPIEILAGWQVIKLLTTAAGSQVCGLLCINQLQPEKDAERYLIVRSRQIVYAVGGPAMCYADSVYPESQMGATGLALLAGAAARNLTEWQYGLASQKPRWNVSGSYQQVLPRYVSTDPDGSDCREFLDDWLPDERRRLAAVFRKGYQWPFDVRKINGSSLIDLLVYRETILENRRVFLDYSRNPGLRTLDFGRLDPEAAGYLEQAGACQETPYLRLCHLNQPAVSFYRAHGVDLATTPLEIRLCAQHHNGGLSADSNWQSNLRGLYPIGEANGSHGPYRPGGSALNSGQVGAWRAAGSILSQLQTARPAALKPYRTADETEDDPEPGVFEQLSDRVAWVERRYQPDAEPFPLADAWQQTTARMSRVGGPFRPVGQLETTWRDVETERRQLDDRLTVADRRQLPLACRYQELLLTQSCCLAAMLDYARRGGGSRGSALYLDPDHPEAVLPAAGLPAFFRSRLPQPDWPDQIQELRIGQGRINLSWRPVQPLPQADDVFEKIWREYRQDIQA